MRLSQTAKVLGSECSLRKEQNVWECGGKVVSELGQWEHKIESYSSHPSPWTPREAMRGTAGLSEYHGYFHTLES